MGIVFGVTGTKELSFNMLCKVGGSPLSYEVRQYSSSIQIALQSLYNRGVIAL
jgi:hypothetical protein